MDAPHLLSHFNQLLSQNENFKLELNLTSLVQRKLAAEIDMLLDLILEMDQNQQMASKGDLFFEVDEEITLYLHPL